MKEKYDGYPKRTVANPVRHSDEAFMEEQYIHNFYNNKEFHVKRIQRGKEIRNKTLGITAIEVAIAAGLAVGSVIHGENFVQDIISAVPNVNIVDILALTVGIAGSIATAQESFFNMQKLSRIHTDLNVSKKMIEKFEEKENNGRTR